MVTHKGFIYLAAPRSQTPNLRPLSAVLQRVQELNKGYYSVVCPALQQAVALQQGVASPLVDDFTESHGLLMKADILYVLPSAGWRQDDPLWEEIFLARKFNIEAVILQPLCPLPGMDVELLDGEETDTMNWSTLTWR